MPKLLHTRIRVNNLKKSVSFYEKLGFKKGRMVNSSPSGNQLVFMEMSDNDHFLELCHHPDHKISVPEDLMHIAIGYSDLEVLLEELEEKGVEIWPENWKVGYQKGSRMYFVTDPDGYEVELLEKSEER